MSKVTYQHSAEAHTDLVRYARRITRNHDYAEEIVQEAYVRLAEAARKQLLTKPAAYLRRVVHNLALDHLKARKCEARLFVAEREADLAAVPASLASPEQQAFSRAEFMKLEEALAELPERTRIAVEMRRFGGAKLREIAEALDITPSMAHHLVMQGVARCLAKLR
ncbi:MAG: sigma-70 family RNA polymerase sigma factor [Acetobacter sp.]|uniref:sigma-70 family RNA polymerase sigma factor n=1 Tax=Acetobacter sp. TaxID=440 RepID=UPI0039EA6FEA